MLHCAPEATLKPKRFEFTTKTVMCNVFVAQVYWEAVPAAAKLLLPNVLCMHGIVRWTSGAGVLDLPKPSVCCQASTDYGGAWPDKDE